MVLIQLQGCLLIHQTSIFYPLFTPPKNSILIYSNEKETELYLSPFLYLVQEIGIAD
jgi:hypothetical protein